MKFKSSLSLSSSVVQELGARMESTSQPKCPDTVPPTTVRRNPHRKAKATPATVAPVTQISSKSVSSNVRKAEISSFPIQDILSMELAENPTKGAVASKTSETEAPQNLKVFLRIRPSARQSVVAKCGNVQRRALNHRNSRLGCHVNASVKGKHPQQQNQAPCLTVNDCHSVTLTPPEGLIDLKRTKSENFSGFSRVFSVDTTQTEVFDMMMGPLVEDFLRGRSGMLAALGPTGSGKTHTLFGNPRDPGMVPLVLRRIFEAAEERDSKSSSRFCISMFEINVERGKGERLSDLCSENVDLSIQQSGLRGLKEVLTSDIAQAESLVARGLLKRATAMTNSNSHSSRSQCIINIRNACCCKEENDPPIDPVLTVVDLAGAEREKRTGNQGARLLESNFINNTSMTFGLCLRSLLEYQKNPKNPLRRHFQNSLLTRYLRDYLEGKKRMALLLTVKPEKADYLDISFLLRQASPYMNIRVCSSKERPSLLCSKRELSMVPKDKNPKRLRLVDHGIPAVHSELLQNETLFGRGVEIDRLLTLECNSTDPTCLPENEKQDAVADPPPHIPENDAVSEGSTHLAGNENLDATKCRSPHTPKKKPAVTERSLQILQNFSRALWAILNQYKAKLHVAKSEIESLKTTLRDEKERSNDLENELSSLKSRCSCPCNILVAETSSSQLGTDSENSNAESSDVRFHVIVSQPNATTDDSRIGPSHFDEVAADVSVKQGNDFDGKCCELLRSNADGSPSLHEGSSLPEKVHSKDGHQTEKSKANVAKWDRDEDPHPIPNSRDSLSGGMKPKRRLLPVSSMLVRDIGALGLEDEDDKAKGNKGEKKLSADDRDRTHHSMSLLRLLSNNLRL